MNHGLVWNNIPYNMEEMIDWLNIVLEKCKDILHEQYQPGGQIFQQIQQINLGRYGMGL